MIAPSINGHGEAPGADDFNDVERYGIDDVLPAEWFFCPWIPRFVYTLIIGQPSSGKSTFGAFLAARARRAIILPGEEDVRRMVLPRLQANGVNLANVCFVRPSDRWSFPRQTERLIRLIQKEGADFVLVDPLDSYAEKSTDENANAPTRRLLDTFSLAAEQTGAAIVLVRHPGKAWDNLLAGSRAFRAHPRAILQLAADPENRARGVLEPFKPPLGRWTDPHFYHLDGFDDEPKRFIMQGTAPLTVAREVQEVPERIERTRIDQAEDFLRYHLGSGEEIPTRTLFLLATQEGLHERALRYAFDRLGIRRRREGRGDGSMCYWKLSPKSENPPL